MYVPEAPRGDADSLVLLLTDGHLHDDFVSRNREFLVNFCFDGVCDDTNPLLGDVLVIVFALQFALHDALANLFHLRGIELFLFARFHRVRRKEHLDHLLTGPRTILLRHLLSLGANLGFLLGLLFYPRMPMATAEQVVTISGEDKAQQLSLSRDGLTLTGDKGYRMARCVVGVESGRWYFECKIVDKSSGHYRLGWATRKAELQAAVGFDKHSFGYRDLSGSIVHASERVDDKLEPYGSGDVVGCLIDLGPDKKSISFFKNGKDQGIAFDDIPGDTYFPAVSLYGNGAQVTANFGPSFAHPPPPQASETDTATRPISDLSSKVPRQAPAKRDVSSSNDASGGGGGTRASKRHRS